jgi:hypothetical protein
MGVEYYAQVIAPIINAFATLILVLVTAVYVWLTKRIVDESAHQNRPYVFLRLDDTDGRRDLRLVNTGHRVARDIVIEIVRDASISISIFADQKTAEESSMVSNLAMRATACRPFRPKEILRSVSHNYTSRDSLHSGSNI